MKPSLRYGLLATLGLCLLLCAPIRGDEPNPAQQQRALELEHKLKSLFVSIDFTNATLDQALQALTVVSKDRDPDHQGIHFVLQPLAAETGQPITLKLDEVPVGVALRYACELGHVRYKVGDRFVTIETLSAGQELVKRTFRVDPNFVETAESAGIIPRTLQPPQ